MPATSNKVAVLKTVLGHCSLCCTFSCCHRVQQGTACSLLFQVPQASSIDKTCLQPFKMNPAPTVLPQRHPDLPRQRPTCSIRGQVLQGRRQAWSHRAPWLPKGQHCSIRAPGFSLRQAVHTIKGQALRRARPEHCSIRLLGCSLACSTGARQRMIRLWARSIRPRALFSRTLEDRLQQTVQCQGARPRFPRPPAVPALHLRQKHGGPPASHPRSPSATVAFVKRRAAVQTLRVTQRSHQLVHPVFKSCITPQRRRHMLSQLLSWIKQGSESLPKVGIHYTDCA